MTTCEQSRIDAEARGYSGHLKYLERMSRHHTQYKCPKCGLFHVWKRKPAKLEQPNPTEDPLQGGNRG